MNDKILNLSKELFDFLQHDKIASFVHTILRDIVDITNTDAALFYIKYASHKESVDIEILDTIPSNVLHHLKSRIRDTFVYKSMQNNVREITQFDSKKLKKNIENTYFNKKNIMVIPILFKKDKKIIAEVEIFTNNDFTDNTMHNAMEIKALLESFLFTFIERMSSNSKLREFSKLIEVSNLLNTTLNIDLLLSRIISEARKTMNSQGCSLMLKDEETDELIFKTVHGEKSKKIKEFRIPPGKGIAGWIVKNKKSVIIDDAVQDKRFYAKSDLSSGFKTKTILGTPLISRGKVIGVIEAVNKKVKKKFTESNKIFFEALANQAAIAIQNAQYYTELRGLFLNTVQSLTAAIDAKDPYTRGHSERVTKYSVMLAKALKLPHEEIERIQLAGLLHDIGKIGIDEKILQKPAKLTESEYKEIQRHPTIGESIMKPIKSLNDILPGIRNHHERWDGKGYPDSLKGENIPLYGRIIALADTYDAMTSDRPYRKGLSKKIALDEINRCAGTQFDPKLAKLFISAIKYKRYEGIKLGVLI